jgi:hypothetical protein
MNPAQSMKYLNKITRRGIIIIAFFLITTAPANAAGFVFNWESIAIDNDLLPGAPDKKVFIKDSSAHDLNIPISENRIDAFALPANQESAATQKAEKKSLLDNIKINISPANVIMDDKYKIYSASDDEQVSKFINAVTSLIYDDSKIKSLETIGKIIEPQINFYFKF